TNGVINTSDARQKKNIQPIQYGLKQILALRPVSFEWKDSNAGTQTMLGLLAQETQTVIPEIVEENNEVMGMRSTELVPVMIKAIQQQQKMIADLQKELKILKQSMKK
ncbi:MAG: tail fiber domain-containing protein, partial [Chitinophagaceae bacterium]